jgi:hypothetical protein
MRARPPDPRKRKGPRRRPAVASPIRSSPAPGNYPTPAWSTRESFPQAPGLADQAATLADDPWAPIRDGTFAALLLHRVRHRMAIDRQDEQHLRLVYARRLVEVAALARRYGA